MPAIDPVQDIKDRLSVESVVGDYVVLKRAGVNFKALCPFHQEKTPSFMVNPERRSWHCFGCSKGGDIFSFVMELEGLEFREALQLLARKAGVELPQRSNDRRQSGRTSRLIEVNTAAMVFFEEQLKTSSVASAELTRRKVDQLTRETFHVGYAPGGWTALTDYLRKKGFSDAEMVAAGVAVARPAPRQGIYDRFRNRLTFPLVDVVGRTIGFSARALDPNEKMGKYINSPESDIYHKGKFLFALNHAKNEIRKRGFVVLVEGQMDAISSHRVGVANVVATSGTALTTEQLRLLKRYTQNLILAFDVDMAGTSATKRGIDLAVEQGFNVKVARMPDGVDPDDLCRETPEAWGEAINKCEAIVEHYIRRTTTDADLGKVEIKKKVANTVLPEVARLTDPVEQTHYLQRPSILLRVEESVLRDALRKYKPGTQRVGLADGAGDRAQTDASVSSAPKKIDPLLRKVARLVALRLRVGTLVPELVAPLSVLSSRWVQEVVRILTSSESEQSIFIELNRVSQDLARLVDTETFALDREMESSDEPPTKEIVELIKGITRDGLRRELTQLHQKAKQVGTGIDTAQLFVQKTQELAKLEEQSQS